MIWVPIDAICYRKILWEILKYVSNMNICEHYVVTVHGAYDIFVHYFDHKLQNVEGCSELYVR